MDAPPTHDLPEPGSLVTLRSGQQLRIRPWQANDTDLLLQAFDRLGPESRYRRFLTPTPTLSGPMLRYLIGIDHHAHEAVVAIDEATGDGVGLARYVRLEDRPDTAELAVTVTDDWHGRGVGTVLLQALCARAREEGITRLTALMLATNTTMMDLLEQLGPVRIVDRSAGTVEVEVPTPSAGISDSLMDLVRVAAQHDVAAPLSLRAAPQDATGPP